MDEEELSEFEEFESSLKYTKIFAPNSYYSDILEEIIDEVEEEIRNAEEVLRLKKEKELKEREREYRNSQI